MIRTFDTSPKIIARLAGALYMIIIACGLFGELGVRSRLVVSGEPAATAQNLLSSPGLFRLGFASDVVMALSDVAVAILLYVLLRPIHRTLALLAAALRLVQTTILGANLLHHFAALFVLGGAGYLQAFETDQRQALSMLFLDLHRHGYDLGLIFFGVHCLVLGILLVRSRYVPRALGILVGLAAVPYLTGSFTLFLFPGASSAVTPLYAIAVLAEVSLGLWLLLKGVVVPASR
jgi:hypothetical protein